MNSSLTNGTAASGNFSYSCSFSSIRQALTIADKGKANITLVVQNCPNICSLVWGIGNPDLSGIGIYISYIIQMVLAVFFGPLFLFAFIPLAWNEADETDGPAVDSRSDEQKKWFDRVESLHNAFYTTSACFCIPVAVAAVARLKQGPPFFEITFIQSLVTMQFCGLFSTTVTAALANALNRMKGTRFLVLLSYLLFDLIFLLAIHRHLRVSKGSWQAIQDLSSACVGYGSIPPVFNNIPDHRLRLQIYLSRVGWIVIGFILATIITAVILWVRAKYQKAKPKGIAWCLGKAIVIDPAVGFILFPSIAAICFLAKLQKTRKVMKDVTGAEFKDDHWGFGQVIAVLLWVPVLVQTVYVAWCLVYAYQNIRHENPAEAREDPPEICEDPAETREHPAEAPEWGSPS